MTDARSDDDLMLAYGRGEIRAFEVLYERYRRPLYRYLFYAVADRATADELFQDTWAKIIDARSRFRRGAGFKRYAFRIARNRLVDHWRSRGREPGTDGDALERVPAGSSAGPDAQAEGDQLRDRLMRALMQLPPDQREAFLLQQEAGLSLEEIAWRGNVGRETIKSRLRYALAKLRTTLQPRPETPEP